MVPDPLDKWILRKNQVPSTLFFEGPSGMDIRSRNDLRSSVVRQSYENFQDVWKRCLVIVFWLLAEVEENMLLRGNWPNLPMSRRSTLHQATRERHSLPKQPTLIWIWRAIKYLLVYLHKNGFINYLFVFLENCKLVFWKQNSFGLHWARRFPSWWDCWPFGKCWNHLFWTCSASCSNWSQQRICQKFHATSWYSNSTI